MMKTDPHLIETEEPKTEVEEKLEPIVKEEPTPKKERKVRVREKKTFESLLMDMPLFSRIRIAPNGAKRNAVNVNSENGKRRIFGYDGAVIIVTREEYLHGIVEIEAEEKGYGFRVEPTVENMIGIQKNYLATLA